MFQIVANPVLESGGSLIWEYVDEVASLMEYSSSEVEVIGGTVLSCLNVGALASKELDMQKIIAFQSPQTTFAIVAGLASNGTGAAMTASATWKEDL